MPRIFGYQIITADILRGPLTILDNQAAPTALISYVAASVSYVQIQYGLVRNGQEATGRIMVSSDGVSVTSIEQDNTGGALGIVFSASISGGNLYINYTSTSTGFNATMKYYEKSWQ